ncbi:uncharacterized protein V1513DRAFT_426997 [Lipomyces chichibuensis]|uniref:uncharacterized protein n=1 Tax=Lipomyces chichibuensis TaxID=1546026 RepID=UPI003343768D
MSISSVLNYLSTALSTAGPEVSELSIAQEGFFAGGPPSPLYDGVFEKSFDGRLLPMLARSPSPSSTASLLGHTQILSYTPIPLAASTLSPKPPRTCNQYQERREGYIISPRLRRSKLSAAGSLLEGLRLPSTDWHLTQRQPNQADHIYGAVATRSNASIPEQKAMESIEMDELKPVLVNSREYSFELIPSVGNPNYKKNGCRCARVRQVEREFMAARTGALRRIESSVFDELENASKLRDLEGNGIDVVSETENDVGKRIVVTAFDTMGLFGGNYDSSSEEEEFESRLKTTLTFKNEAERRGVGLNSNMSALARQVSGRSDDQSPSAILTSREGWLPIGSLEMIEELNNTSLRSRSSIEERGVDDKETDDVPANGNVSANTVKVYPFLSTGAMQPLLQLGQLEPDIFENEMIGLSVAAISDNKSKRSLFCIFKRKPLERINHEALNIRIQASLKSLSIRKWKLQARKHPRNILASIEKRLDIFTKIFKSRNSRDREQPVHPLFEDSFDDFMPLTVF